VKDLSVFTHEAKSSLPSHYTYNVADELARREAPSFDEANPVNIQSFGMDIVTQYLKSLELLSRFATPVVLY
jgi:hypothetical protein